MPQIIPIKELRNTNEISEMCHRQQEPIYVTKNGYGDLVIMSMETYEKNLALAQIYQKLHEAEMQLQNGELVDGEDFMEKMRVKYGR